MDNDTEPRVCFIKEFRHLNEFSNYIDSYSPELKEYIYKFWFNNHKNTLNLCFSEKELYRKFYYHEDSYFKTCSWLQSLIFRWKYPQHRRFDIIKNLTTEEENEKN